VPLLRALNLNPSAAFSHPKVLPQNPSEAHTVANQYAEEEAGRTALELVVASSVEMGQTEGSFTLMMPACTA